MKKKSGKGKARAIKDLPVSVAKAQQAKGGQAAPVLLKACTTGEHIKEATITV